MDVLKRLAEGKVYKQIAHELALSTSTVRTHLHNIYGKLGAVDRAQAVLVADRARLDLGPRGSSRIPARGSEPAADAASVAAISTPVESISTSTGEPWRPAMNVWWNSSVVE